jgi:hypothetical protein
MRLANLEEWLTGADPKWEETPTIEPGDTVYNGPRVQTHVFLDEGQAYDASQCEDYIKDGDILVAERERTVAILIKAWPTLVAGTLEPDWGSEFHRLNPEENWATFEGGKYVFHAAEAWTEAQRRGWA